MFYEGINAKVFRRSIAFILAAVATSRSSSFEYTISVHAVHAGTERNVCNIVVSTELHQSISNPAPRVQTSTLTPAPPQVLTSKTPQPLAQPFYADAQQMLVKDLVHRPKYTWSAYHLSTWRYVSVHEMLSLIAFATTQISLSTF